VEVLQTLRTGLLPAPAFERGRRLPGEGELLRVSLAQIMDAPPHAFARPRGPVSCMNIVSTIASAMPASSHKPAARNTGRFIAP
jgi:hypothetical protein